MVGRKPKPISQQINEGDPRKRGVNKLREQLAAEPKASRGLPDCPRHLRGCARAKWNEWRAELEVMDIDRRCDAAMLEVACMAFEAVSKSYDTFQKEGRIVEFFDIKRQATVLRNHPAVGQWERASAIMKGFCAEFALSPASRSRTKTEDKPDTQKSIAQLLAVPRAPRAAVGA